MSEDLEMKGLVDNILKKFGSIMSRVLSREYVGTVIRRSYNKGLEDFESNVHPLGNIVPNDDAIDFLSDYTFDLIKGLNDETMKNLRTQMVQGIMHREGAAKIAVRVRDVMGVSKARAATIARTETHRAYNAGEMFAAKQSGIALLKEVHNPSPESDICKALVKRDPIPIDDKWRYDGADYLLAPFHPNCRSVITFSQLEAE